MPGPPHSLEWRREWGLLAAAALLALPLFTPRLYAIDEIKYLAHLRSPIFDGDLHYANEYGHFVALDPVRYGDLTALRDEVSPTGRRLNDGPIGSAVLWAPFYLLADAAVLVARALGASVRRDGFSGPYVFAICLASLVWGTLGLVLVYRTCRLYFDSWSSQLAVLGLWFASPLVFYLYITPPMAHANSLFAASLFLYLWLRHRREGGERTLQQWALLGAAGGLMILVRELNWLLLAPLLLDESWSVLRARGVEGGPLRALRRRLPGYLACAVVLGLVVAPQFVVYRLLHGTFGPTPFVARKFSWLPAHAPAVLFSGFHGLFSWTPVTLVGVLGLWALGRQRPRLATWLALAFALQVAVIGSYASWWGGASFGARRFINCTPVFALGLAAILQPWPWKRWLAALAIGLLIVWNFGLAIQYSTGIIPRDQPVALRTLVANQFVEVPSRLADVALRFLTDRSSFFEGSRPAPRENGR